MQYRNIIRRCSCTGIFALIIVDLIRGIILVTVTVVIASAGIISTIVTAVTVVISIVTVTTVVGISIIRVFAVISVSGVISLIRGICIIIIVIIIIITVIEMLVTVFSRNGTYVKVFSDHRTAGSWKKSGFLADT